MEQASSPVPHKEEIFLSHCDIPFFSTEWMIERFLQVMRCNFIVVHNNNVGHCDGKLSLLICQTLGRKPFVSV
jgi:hypothetical protein